MRTVIIDDEAKSRAALRNLLTTYCTGVDVIAEADGVHQGIEVIHENKPDVLFLDIRMRDGSGFDLLQQLEKIDFQVIFITAFDEFAIRAFKFSAIDYLLKPIDVEELENAVRRAKERIELQSTSNTSLIQNLLKFNQSRPKITISTDDAIEFVPVDQIIRLESDGGYTCIHCLNGVKLTASKNLKVFDEILSEYEFIRVHYSHVISVNYVERFVKRDGGYLVMSNGDQVPVSRRRKEAFIQKYAS